MRFEMELSSFIFFCVIIFDSSKNTIIFSKVMFLDCHNILQRFLILCIKSNLPKFAFKRKSFVKLLSLTIRLKKLNTNMRNSKLSTLNYNFQNIFNFLTRFEQELARTIHSFHVLKLSHFKKVLSRSHFLENERAKKNELLFLSLDIFCTTRHIPFFPQIVLFSLSFYQLILMESDTRFYLAAMHACVSE